VEVVAKPAGSLGALFGEELRRKVRLAAGARLQPSLAHSLERTPVGAVKKGKALPTTALVVIAASTGGPRALGEILPHLRQDLAAGIIIVQHMPIGFTKALAERLNDISVLTVREAREGDRIEAGTALVALAGRHLVVESAGRIRMDDSPPRHGVRPAADVTFESAARVYGKRCLGVVLTGMGQDGAAGLLEVRRLGGYTIAESAETAVIYGMPRTATEMGAVVEVLPLHRIADHIMEQIDQWQNIPT